MRIDTLIFGGGVAGLWLLNALRQRGRSALLVERYALGAGQTVASQGILHGGFKYTLNGLLSQSAVNVQEMPRLWRNCLSGANHPKLDATPLRSGHCYLWQTNTLASRIGMLGARLGLRVTPKFVPNAERPEILRSCRGSVVRLDEQVISPVGMLENLIADHQDCILHVGQNPVPVSRSSDGTIRTVRVHAAGQRRELEISPRQIVLAAGAGNGKLRQCFGLAETLLQRRPLHMVMVRGDLPSFNGHCVDGAHTRVTITSDQDADGRTVWQIGGQIAESGVDMEPDELVPHAVRELKAVLPAVDTSSLEWATYRVDRAELAVPGGRRPDSYTVLREANIYTAWPTKLVLAPAVAADLVEMIGESECELDDMSVVADWPRPRIAAPPWEDCSWYNALGKPVADEHHLQDAA